MKSDFKKRRKILMEKIRNDSVLIIPSAQHQKRTRDVDYPYRQDSDFYYLTGFRESDSLMMSLYLDIPLNIAKSMPNNFLSDLQPGLILLSKVLWTSLNAILFVKSFDGKEL